MKRGTLSHNDIEYVLKSNLAGLSPILMSIIISKVRISKVRFLIQLDLCIMHSKGHKKKPPYA